MFPVEVFDPATLAIVGVLLMPVVSGITQLFVETFPDKLVGVKVRWAAALVGALVFGIYIGTQVAPAPYANILTWAYGLLSFSLATSGNIDLVKSIVKKSSNPLNERVG
jgi:hypothetical protein